MLNTPVRLDRREIDVVHTALFGWPVDPYSPPDLADLPTLHDVGLTIMDSRRFRWFIRDKLGLWPTDKWVCTDFEGRNGGYRLWVNLHDSFVGFGVLNNDWESPEVDFMLSRLSPGVCMVDVGANVGVFTVQAARAVGASGQVHAFEASPQVGKMLMRSVFDNGLAEQCTVHACGLGDADVDGHYHRSLHSTNPGASYISQEHREDGAAGEAITIRRLDSIHFDRRVSFIKMDVEGFEERVIAGGMRLLTEHRPCVLSELFPRALRHIGGNSAGSYVARWEALGYRIAILEHGQIGTELTSATVGAYEEIDEPINIVCEPIDARP